MARSARDFPLVSAALDDPAIRALFTERFLVATEIYDALVDAACWKLLGDVGARSRRRGRGEERRGDSCSIPRARPPGDPYMIEKLADAGIFLEG